MPTKNIKKGSGGARPGAGRKLPATKIKATFTINKQVLAHAKKHFKGKLSRMVENFIKEELLKIKDL